MIFLPHCDEVWQHPGTSGMRLAPQNIAEWKEDENEIARLNPNGILQMRHSSVDPMNSSPNNIASPSLLQHLSSLRPHLLTPTSLSARALHVCRVCVNTN